MTDEEKAYNTYLWEQNHAPVYETQATLNAESEARAYEIYLKNSAEAEEEEVFYEEDPNFEYNPTTPSEPADPNDIPF